MNPAVFFVLIFCCIGIVLIIVGIIAWLIETEHGGSALFLLCSTIAAIVTGIKYLIF